MTQTLKHTVYPPWCAANPSDSWLCEIRQGGFIHDWNHLDSAEAAEFWGANYSNEEISPKASALIVSMVHRWANK
jgi:hypothetical protein